MLTYVSPNCPQNFNYVPSKFLYQPRFENQIKVRIQSQTLDPETN